MDRVIESRATAVAELTQTMSIDPGNARAYFERGLIRPGEDERELVSRDQAVRLDPESAD